MIIRKEKECDFEAVNNLLLAAFEDEGEAKLVSALRIKASPVISLVAEIHDKIVGYIMFSPVKITGHEDFKIMGLAPVAVLPEHQNKGIGAALINEGLDNCRKLGFQAAVLLGHAEYYPRFGFKQSTKFGLICPYEGVPPECFMAKELFPGSLSKVSGQILFHPAFSEL
ncbi:MAG: N-acetyltransferase [Alphaproteobacteria bacterium]|nr:N-acetyltransferase [Alphaproteobacteria bacterium]HRW29747.1 N-acetyltransferase [Emcibacteraceae bacterium]